jgi:hypothetical protein
LIRLVLTWPYERAAEVVEVRLDKVESVREVEEPHATGEVLQTENGHRARR